MTGQEVLLHAFTRTKMMPKIAQKTMNITHDHTMNLCKRQMKIRMKNHFTFMPRDSTIKATNDGIL